MYPITKNIASYFPNNWQEKYARLLENEHWTSFIKQFNQYLKEEDIQLRLPYFSEEITPPIHQIMGYFKAQYEIVLEDENHLESAWAKVLQNAPFEYLLIVLGQRLTSASILDHTAIPPLKQTLLDSCFEPYNHQICVATRAWEKHVGRSKDNFWGEIKGNPSKKDMYVKNLILEMLNHQTWWNVFEHYKHKIVYEIRIKSGHGVRWTQDGTAMIGFLEPFINECV